MAINFSENNIQSNRMTNDHSYIHEMAARAKAALPVLATIPSATLQTALNHFADALIKQSTTILHINATEIESAKSKNLSDAMIDRLSLNTARLESIAASVRQIAQLENPCGRILSTITRPNGLKISRVSVPLGVLGIIYESRPNVTIDAACLSLISRNACLLRGGSECINTSKSLYDLLIASLSAHKLPLDAVQFVDNTDRALVGDMLNAAGYIDVIIPRGGKSLTERVMNEAKMPVFAHLDGNCHTYIHASADAEMARSVCLNAKLRRTGICGATETILIDKNFPKKSAATILTALLDAGCILVGDETAQSIDQRVQPATNDDWSTEYLCAKCAVKFVDTVNDAVQHINHYGSHHTESIIASDKAAVDYFFNFIDSAIVMHNASTQFADGGEFGMGAEIGIATGRFHARGPVGVEQLTTYKYIVEGNGHIRPV